LNKIETTHRRLMKTKKIDRAFVGAAAAAGRRAPTMLYGLSMMTHACRNWCLPALAHVVAVQLLLARDESAAGVLELGQMLHSLFIMSGRGNHVGAVCQTSQKKSKDGTKASFMIMRSTVKVLASMSLDLPIDAQQQLDSVDKNDADNNNNNNDDDNDDKVADEAVATGAADNASNATTSAMANTLVAEEQQQEEAEEAEFEVDLNVNTFVDTSLHTLILTQHYIIG
jgi:hypothetical protein